MRKFVSLLVLVLLVVPSIIVESEESKISEEEGLILALIQPHVTEAVNHYYGRMKTFDLENVSIVNVKESDCSYCFNVTVQLVMDDLSEDLESTDVMTFAVNKGKVVPIQYERKKGISQD